MRTIFAVTLMMLAAPALAQTADQPLNQPQSPLADEQQAAQPGQKLTAPGQTSSAMTADQFVREAIRDNLADIEAARLAQANAAATPTVQQLGARIARDATQTSAQLARLASERNTQVSSDLAAEDRMALDRIGKLQGQEFGRQYVQWLVTDLEQDQRLYQQAAQSGDPAVSQLARQALAAIQANLQAAKDIQASQAAAAPNAGSGAAPAD